jgi:hypothetical protein
MELQFRQELTSESRNMISKATGPLNRCTFLNNPLLRRLLARLIRNRGDVLAGAGILLIARQLFEGLSLGLGNAQRGEDAEEHEEGVDLHDVVLVRVSDRFGGGALGAELGDAGLSDDGADLAHAGGETVGG